MENAYIESLSILNFKKFSQVSVKFSPGLNILVGPNNSGKTTLLEALNILLDERNLSPLSVKRNMFNKFVDDSTNIIRLVARIKYPQVGTTKDNEINFIKQLKVGKGSFNSTLPRLIISTTEDITEEKLINGEINSNTGEFDKNTSKSRVLVDLFLMTEIVVNESYESEVKYSVFINSLVDGSKENFQLVGISGSQRVSLFNYLYVPPNRIGNKTMFEVNDFNWLGRYFRECAKNQDDKQVLLSSLKDVKYPQYLDDVPNNIIGKFFYNKASLKINVVNDQDPDSLIGYAKVFVADPCNDEVINKGQGVQSATAISLFAGYSQQRCQKMPSNKELKKHWGTVFSIEEPESHFHTPLRHTFLKVIKDEFLDLGAQVFISTHDENFIKWNYTSNANLIFPGSEDNEQIKTINLSTETDSNYRRIVRFNSHALFSKNVLILEGQEEACIDLLIQSINEDSLYSQGIVLTRSVCSIRSKDDDKSDLQPMGGKDNIASNIEFFNSINIKTFCLLDLDVLNDGGETVKGILLSKGVDKQEIDSINIPTLIQGSAPKPYLANTQLWSDNKKNLIEVINSLEKYGIFIFPGDFESLFVPEFLEKYEYKDKNTDEIKIIKEKLAYEVKYLVESDDLMTLKLSVEGKEFLRGIFKKIVDFNFQISSQEEDCIDNVASEDETIALSPGECNQKDGLDDLPF